MPTTALATFADVLSRFRGQFTAPTFVRFLVLVVGWILSCDPSAGWCVTEALVAAKHGRASRSSSVARSASSARYP